MMSKKLISILLVSVLVCTTPISTIFAAEEFSEESETEHVIIEGEDTIETDHASEETNDVTTNEELQIEDEEDFEIQFSKENVIPGETIEITLKTNKLEYTYPRINANFESVEWTKGHIEYSYSQYAHETVFLDYDEQSQSYIGEFTIPEKAPNGKWKLTYLSIYEFGKEYDVSFNVESEYVDVIAPTLKDISFYKEYTNESAYQTKPLTIYPGEEITVVIDAVDNEGGVGVSDEEGSVFVSLTNLQDEDGEFSMVTEFLALKNIPNTTKYLATLVIPEDVKKGILGLRVWGVEDTNGNGIYTGPDIITPDKTLYIKTKEEEYQPSLVVNGNKAIVNTTDDYFNMYLVSNENANFTFDNPTVKELKLELSAKQLSSLTNKNIKTITLGNDGVSMTIPLEVLSIKDTILKIVNTGSNGDSITDVFDFTIMQDNEELSIFDQDVTLRFELKENVVHPFVYNVKNDGLQEITSKFENDVVYGYTSHFSKFAVYEKQVTEAPAEDVVVETPNDTDAKEETTIKQPIETEKDESTIQQQVNAAESDNELPNTASNFGNLFAIGLIFIIAGALFLFKRNRTV